jgi:predicted dehydrogenase
MRTPVSLGVVGLGRWGAKVARAFDDSPLADVRWVHEERSAAGLRRRLRGVPAVAFDLHELLADETLDALAIATPAANRCALARRALEADKHVYVAGPLGVGARETAELIGVAASRHRRLMIGPALLFDPGVRKLRELIEIGRLGEIYYLTATFTSSEPEHAADSVLVAEADAAVAALLYLLGDEPISTWWMADSYVQAQPEIACCCLRFATGITATVQASWLDARDQRRIVVVGSRRTAVFDAGQPRRKLTVYEKGSARGAEIVSPRIAPGKALHLQCEAFLTGVRAAVEYPGTRLAPAVARVLESAAGGPEACVRQRAVRPALRLAERGDEAASLSTTQK